MIFDPSQRGNHAVYRDGETNHCPGCGRTHWHIGRVTAECGFCATALPLESSGRGRTGIFSRGKGGGKVARMACAA